MSVDTRDRLLRLLSALYAAPGEPDAWQAFLLDLCTSLDGTGANFISMDFTAQQGSIALTARTDPAAIRDYLAHWATEDPWAHSPGMRNLPAGTVVVGDQLVDRRALMRTPFYCDFARHYDIAQSIVAVVEGDQREAVSVVSINGGARRAEFDERDRALLAALTPHLQRALQIHRRIASAERAADDSKAALDRLSHGVLLVDGRGRVVYTNRAADDVLRARDGLYLDRGELRASSPTGTAALRRALASAIGTATENGTGTGGAVALGRPSGRRALEVVIGPLVDRRPEPGTEGASAVVFVTDPERRPTPSPELMRTLFGLTPAEARVAIALLDGAPLDRVAARLSVSRNTVRTHLQRIFAKTNTRRQSELVRTLLAVKSP